MAATGVAATTVATATGATATALTTSLTTLVSGAILTAAETAVLSSLAVSSFVVAAPVGGLVALTMYYKKAKAAEKIVIVERMMSDAGDIIDAFAELDKLATIKDIVDDDVERITEGIAKMVKEKQAKHGN